MITGHWHIVGTGIDIVETDRVRESIEKFGDRFLNRCFWPSEIAYCQSMKFPAMHLAARFAAKESISKAFGTGIGRELGWKDMEIGRRDTGEPHVILHDKGQALALSRGVQHIFISLTHCRSHAAAHAIAVGAPPS